MRYFNKAVPVLLELFKHWFTSGERTRLAREAKRFDRDFFVASIVNYCQGAMNSAMQNLRWGVGDDELIAFLLARYEMWSDLYRAAVLIANGQAVPEEIIRKSYDEHRLLVRETFGEENQKFYLSEMEIAWSRISPYL